MVARIIQNQIDRIEYREKGIFWTLFFVFISLLTFYGFMINKTISNAISKQSMEEKILTLNTNVNSMESEYLNLKDNITLDLALSKGFVKNSNVKYAVISSDRNLSLSVNEN